MGIKGQKMRRKEEKKIKLPKIVEENNCVPTWAAGIFKTRKFKGWMMDSTQTIGLELLPVKIILAASRFFYKWTTILP